jgi:hypothetical protein
MHADHGRRLEVGPGGRVGREAARDQRGSIPGRHGKDDPGGMDLSGPNTGSRTGPA